MSFKVLDHSTDRALWLTFWESWSEREPAAHPDYAALFARDTDRCCCAVHYSERGTVLLPFIERPLSTEPWAEVGEEAVDLVTPYGYGGPFFFAGDRIELAEAFWPEWDAWARERHAVSFFARLSLFDDQKLKWPEGVSPKQPNIVRSLRLDAKALWMDYKHKVRKNTKRARRAGLTVEFDAVGAELEAFCDIYTGTLNRNEAQTGYYFSRQFFQTIISALPDNHILVHVRTPDGEIVSTELVLASKTHLYSFLGGTRASAFSDRPNDLLKHAVCEWGIESGRTDFVLGGGYRERDGIFNYKASFAPGGEVMFEVGERIFSDEACAQLVGQRAAWERGQGHDWAPKQGFFPAYRA